MAYGTGLFIAVTVLVIALVGGVSRNQRFYLMDKANMEMAVTRIDSTIRVLRSDERLLALKVQGVQDTILMHEAEIRSLMKGK